MLLKGMLLFNLDGDDANAFRKGLDLVLKPLLRCIAVFNINIGSNLAVRNDVMSESPVPSQKPGILQENLF